MNMFKGLMITGVLVCAFAFTALAQNPTAFTDEQRTEYAKLYTAYETKVMPLHDKLMAKMMELRSIEHLQTTTVADVQKVIGEMTALKEQMRVEQQAFNAQLEKAGLPAFGGAHSQRGGYHGAGGYHGGGSGGCPAMNCGQAQRGCPQQ